VGSGEPRREIAGDAERGARATLAERLLHDRERRRTGQRLGGTFTGSGGLAQDVAEIIAEARADLGGRGRIAVATKEPRAEQRQSEESFR
jgi:hypothetical protein